MIVFLEEGEAWSTMMVISAVAMDNADISDDARHKLRLWQAEHKEGTKALEGLTEAMNNALNAHIDAQFTRRVKSKGRYETVRK
jgi:hypothetical protein